MTEKEFKEAKERFDNALLGNYCNGTLFKDKKYFTMNDVISEIQDDTLKEIDKSEEEKYLTDEGKKRNSFFKLIVMKTIGKLLTPLKIRITIFWNEKEILTYEIPKN